MKEINVEVPLNIHYPASKYTLSIHRFTNIVKFYAFFEEVINVIHPIIILSGIRYSIEDFRIWTTVCNCNPIFLYENERKVSYLYLLWSTQLERISILKICSLTWKWVYLTRLVTNGTKEAHSRIQSRGAYKQ